ncbi:MAG: PBECR2 nuclease fold domain-containing protein [Nanoarchaeota archaeon]
MIGEAISKNEVKIRLTEERWFHITESHDYMSGLSELVLETINNPEEIITGERGELIAIQKFNNKHIVVIYREATKNDGFVITAFVTSQIERIKKERKILWKK